MRALRLSLSVAFLTLVASPWCRSEAPAVPDKDASAAALREQSIYVPYRKLWEVFEKEGRGVFLPYEEFMRLWNAAAEAQPRAVKVEPPADALITELAAVAAVSNDVVTVTADLRIDVLKEGWHTLPIRLDDVAITQARVGETPARLVRDPGKGYSLLFEKKGKEPEVLQLHLVFAKSFTRAPGRNSVSFQTPPAPVSRWEVRVPEPGVKVEVLPLLAATDVPAAASNLESRVLAFVGATPDVSVQWTPRAEGAKGMAALANVTAEQQVWLDEGSLRSRVTLAYEISRAELSQLRLEAPAGYKVVNVFDPNVREWRAEEADGKQVITVQLFAPTKGSQPLVIELEQFAEQKRAAAPMLKALDVGRQQGVVVVKLGPGLRAEPASRDGLLQVDPPELPAGLRQSAWDFSYRYAALPFSLVLNVDKVTPRILAESLAAVHLQPEEIAIDFHVLYDIQRAGVFQLELLVPDGFEVREVRGLTHGEAAAVDVDGHQLGDAKDGLRRLLVSLSRKAEGRVGLSVVLHRDLREPDLLTPTGKPVRVPVPTPRARTAAVERENGRVVVYGPESLKLNPVEQKGLRLIPQAEAVRGMPATARDNERPVLCFASSDEAAALTLSAERRAPQVTVRQLLLARIESGVVKYEATFFCDVLYSGVRAIRIDVPQARAEKIRIATPDIRQTVLGTNQAAGVEAGYAAWRLEGESEFLGSRTIRMQWEEPLKVTDVGQKAAIELPRLTPRGVDRAWGQIVLAKAEGIEVTPGEARLGLRPIDPRQDLMAGAQAPDAARAFEFHDDWRLAVDARRYEPKDVKATSIECGLVRMVVTRSGLTSVQAVYRLRSAQQRLSVQIPGKVSFDTQPARINGKPVALEQSREGTFFVPLASQSPDEAFLLELRYVLSGAGLSLQVPAFPNEPAVQKVYLSVHVPEDLVYLGSTGNWTEEQVWVLRGFNMWPRGNRPSDALLRWVSGNVGVDASALAGFATDGRHLLFSTLRPAPGAAGALRLKAMRAWVLQALLLALIVGIGLVLVPTALATRLAAIGLAAIALIVAAVFTPSLARAVVTNATVGAALVVLIVWVLWFVLVALPRDPLYQARRRLRAELRAKRKAEATVAPVASPPPLNRTANPGRPPSPGGPGSVRPGGADHA